MGWDLRTKLGSKLRLGECFKFLGLGEKQDVLAHPNSGEKNMSCGLMKLVVGGSLKFPEALFSTPCITNADEYCTDCTRVVGGLEMFGVFC